MKKLMRQPPKLGVCWYTAEEWRRIKSEAIDAERFEATYPEWCNMAEKTVHDLQRSGLHPFKVIVVAEELRQWCEVHNKPNSAASRSEFVAELLLEKERVSKKEKGQKG